MNRSTRLAWGTRALGGISIGTVAVLIGAEAVRVWRLGKLPLTHGAGRSGASSDSDRVPLMRAPATLFEGYKVSSTRENTMLNMVASFVTTFAITRGITHAIRAWGGLGPIRNLSSGGRHIHHLVPGTVLALLSGGTAISLSREPRNRWLAIPFGVGSALVLDEAALLLELDDVYWSEEGRMSVRIAFATIGLLGAIGYAIQVQRRGQPGTEVDWVAAAKAWQDLQLTPGSTARTTTGVADR